MPRRAHPTRAQVPNPPWPPAQYDHSSSLGGRGEARSDLHGATLVLLRHGESEHHAAGILSGMCDPDLSPEGRDSARLAGAALRQANLLPDRVWVSALARARHTAAMAVRAGGFAETSTEVDRRLDERNYGAYNGRRKNEIVDELGYEQYLRIRRDVEHRPPPMTPAQRQRFAAGHPFLTCTPEQLSGSESFADVAARVEAFYQDRLRPALALSCRTVMVVTHGDTLRALCSIIDDLSPAEIRDLTVPAAVPLVYRFDWLLRTEHRGGRYLVRPGAAPRDGGSAGERR